MILLEKAFLLEAPESTEAAIVVADEDLPKRLAVFYSFVIAIGRAGARGATTSHQQTDRGRLHGGKLMCFSVDNCSCED